MIRNLLPVLLVVLTAHLPAATPPPDPDPRPDLVIRNARIADGTGKAAFNSDVAIRAGRIHSVGPQLPPGRQELDATGLLLAPGFIDVHTHGEDILDLPAAENFLRMGVTTLVLGNCGSSYNDVPTLFKSLEATRFAPNIASLAGHGTIRAQVMGGSFLRPPTASELHQMEKAVEDAMRAGALGLSTGLIYTPGLYARTDELVALARVAARHGGIYASHMRDEGAAITNALEEVFQIAREAHIPAEISHLKLSGPDVWGHATDILALIENHRRNGLTLTFDTYAYTASSTSLGTLLPDWTRTDNTNQSLRVLVNNPTQKNRIVGEMKSSLTRSHRTNYSHAIIAHHAADPRLDGLPVPAAAQLRHNSSSLDSQIQLILEVQLAGGASAVFHNMSEADLRIFLQHPLGMFASDSGIRKWGEGFPHPRGYGNNARILARYVREQHLLTLEEAIRRMTSLPADTFHLQGRGRILPGAAADLILFSPDHIQDLATFEKPHAYATGIQEVFVNGTRTIRSGKLTNERNGRVVRRNQP